MTSRLLLLCLFASALVSWPTTLLAAVISVTTELNGNKLDLTSIEASGTPGSGEPNRLFTYAQLIPATVSNFLSVAENNATNTITVLGHPDAKAPEGTARLQLLGDRHLNTGIFNPSALSPGVAVTFSRPVRNGPGGDLVIFELTIGSGQTPDPLVVRQQGGVGVPRSVLSSHYQLQGGIPIAAAPNTFLSTVENGGTTDFSELTTVPLTNFGVVSNPRWHATHFDLSWLGVPDNGIVSQIEILSGDATRAPDLLMVVGLPYGTVPEPSAAILVLSGLATLSVRSRRGMRASARRRGFSLIELLVAIAIMGVLIAILLPALQSVREAARSTQCRSHLRQIAFASHGFHEAHGKLPPSRIAKQHPSGLYLLLPYLEEHNVQWEGALRDSMYLMPESIRTHVVPVYLCPSRDRESPIVTIRADNVAFFPDRGYFAGSVSDYVVCKGAREPGVAYGGANVTNENGAVVHAVHSAFPGNAKVITWWKSRTSLSQMADGTSNTFLAGELSLRRAEGRHAFNGDQTGGEFIGLLDPPTANRDEPGFGSDHPGIIQFALCDGSVSAFDLDTDLAIFDALATRAGQD